MAHESQSTWKNFLARLLIRRSLIKQWWLGQNFVESKQQSTLSLHQKVYSKNFSPKGFKKRGWEFWMKFESLPTSRNSEPNSVTDKCVSWSNANRKTKRTRSDLRLHGPRASTGHVGSSEGQSSVNLIKKNVHTRISSLGLSGRSGNQNVINFGSFLISLFFKYTCSCLKSIPASFWSTKLSHNNFIPFEVQNFNANSFQLSLCSSVLLAEPPTGTYSADLADQRRA